MDKKLNFEFTVEQVNIILGSLGRMPYEAVAGLIPEIQRQAQGQLDGMPRDVPPPPFSDKAN